MPGEPYLTANILQPSAEEAIREKLGRSLTGALFETHVNPESLEV
jgi:hypothetical protein